ncbi:MAG: phosphodiester glycosidase family protein, partial [Gemmatimonadetes bacterium]|nr:phosphodiester glycosidase family protein [Gemmatimonadota bacterium]
WEVVPSGPGLAYLGLLNEAEPWAVHLLRVELGRCELGLHVLEAPVGRGTEAGRTRVSELAARGGEVLAAVNGDFFTPEGLPVGTEVVMGVPRRIRSRPAFAWRPGAPPWMGTPEREGDSVLVLGWDVPRPSGDAVTEVVSGFPLLLRNGLRVGDLEVSDRPSFAQERHPRTALGWDSDLDLLWIVVVDGRQPDHSVGMTLPELTSLMESLGVEDALNLDGGGSSVMVFGAGPVSSPSDADGERPVANALGVLRDPGLCHLQL